MKEGTADWKRETGSQEENGQDIGDERSLIYMAHKRVNSEAGMHMSSCALWFRGQMENISCTER